MHLSMPTLSLLVLGLAVLPASTFASDRSRDLGVPFTGEPGPNNTITDVAGIEVGHSTLIKGEGRLVRGKGPVRTGVTAIHPRGKESTSPVFGAWFTLNASGEMTGTTWLDERGLIDGPLLITNTHSVGVVRDAAVEWMVDKGWSALWHAPIVAETYDGALNDINGFHVKKRHAMDAMRNAAPGPVLEGAVGGGTGMMCNRFKGGIGTSSRVVDVDGESYTVGVLVQCNYGRRSDLKQIASIPVSILMEAPLPCYENPSLRPDGAWAAVCSKAEADETNAPDGSIIVVVATDAPLLPHQLKRVAKRPSLALGWLGAVSNDGSGDIFIAFSTAQSGIMDEENIAHGISMYPNNDLTVLFDATVQATEEAIVNAMVAAETMVGANSLKVFELPEEKLRQIMTDTFRN
ncbi:P1 family peptidase [Hyphococcus flavus]|uniref:P1 family peptidase n=1 Tax=Hyphococcus flavus TaxID=1866326 RepID=A0AAE9ZCK3_9PROT|nr:P1 family peptidase [Hyphococcus flavus]WDI30078.1 P1 family peptidase [Hyphococcus flavus]